MGVWGYGDYAKRCCACAILHLYQGIIDECSQVALLGPPMVKACMLKACTFRWPMERYSASLTAELSPTNCCCNLFSATKCVGSLEWCHGTFCHVTGQEENNAVTHICAVCRSFEFVANMSVGDTLLASVPVAFDSSSIPAQQQQQPQTSQLVAAQQLLCTGEVEDVRGESGQFPSNLTVADGSQPPIYHPRGDGG